jgi:cell division protein FtsW (lipid II flippase)
MAQNSLGIRKNFFAIDWMMILSLLPILGAGLVTMNSFTGESGLFNKQVAWIAVSFIIFFVLSFVDFRFLRRTRVLVGLFLASCLLLLILLAVAGV